MKRSKLTPEVILKAITAFLFGLVTGFFSLRLVKIFSPDFVFALPKFEFKKERIVEEKPEEKTTFPFSVEVYKEKTVLKNDSENIEPTLRTFPVIKVEEPEPEESPEEKQEEEPKSPEEETPAKTPEDAID